jgi:hypothetical protein
MNETGFVPLVDTSRDELRERIALAHQRFDVLVRAADPVARPPGHDWTVSRSSPTWLPSGTAIGSSPGVATTTTPPTRAIPSD